MKLIVLYGIPGVGKKTVALELEKVTGFKLMDNHTVIDLVRRLIPQKFPVSVEIARQIRLLLIKGLLAIDCPGLIITFAGGSSGAADYLKELVKMIEDACGQVYFVELSCELNEVRRRIEEPSRKGHFKVVLQQELDEFLLKDYFKGLPDYESLRVDTTYIPPEESAAKIASHLNMANK